MVILRLPLVLASVLAVSLVATLCSADSRRLDYYSRQRRASIDDNILGFINEALGTLKDLMKGGIPELGVAPLEPVKLDNFSIDLRKSGAHIRSNMTNMTLFGISTLTVQKVGASLEKHSLSLQLAFSNWTVHGHYNMSGHLLKIVPVNGVGPFMLEADGVVVSGTAALHRLPNGTLTVDNLALDMTVDTVTSHFSHLNGGGAASAVSNALVNALGKTVFNKAKPKLIEKIKTTLLHTLNRKLQSVHLKF